METTTANLFVLLVISCMISSVAAVSPRPNPAHDPKFARWLVSEGAWGVLTVLDAGCNPFSNVMSYADAGSGVLYFYLTTTLDPTGAFAVNQSTSCFTLSETELGSCGGASQPDPQSPLCSHALQRLVRGQIKGYGPPKECNEVECPKYSVVHSQKEFEIKSYSQALWTSYKPVVDSSIMGAIG